MTTSTSLFDTFVGELTLLDGRRQSEAAHMAALTPPRRAHADRRHETLFVFLDLGGGGAGGLARAMFEQFTRAYWRCSGAVTSALRQAVAAANAHMLEENRLLVVNQRRRGGLVCAVLRDDNLYLAQVGPAKALLAQGGQVVQFPAEPAPEGQWDVVAGAQPEALPLGMSSGLDIHFDHHYLNAGDLLLLTGKSWSEGLPEGALSAALGAAGTSAEEIMLALERWAGTGAFSALVIECAPREVSQVRPAFDAGVGAPSRARDEPGRVGSARETGAKRRRRLPNLLSGVSLGPERLGRTRQGLQQAGATLGDGARALLTRVLPESEPAPHRRRRRAGRAATGNVAMMAGIAVVIPLLVAFVVVTFYLQRSASARRDALVNKAHEVVQAAREASDQEAHARWDLALQAAQEALLAVPDDDELLAMRAEARATLDALDGIVRPELIPLGDYGPGEARRLAATRLQVYLLDPAQDQVTQPTLDSDQLTLVAYRGERVGDEEIGELRDAVWLEAGGAWVSDALLILTDDDRLLQYSLSWGLSWVPFDTGLAHVDARLLSPYDGKLYALDPGQSQVWRFPFTDNGFGPPEGYFPAAAPDLSSAIDMTIDGAVYILLADGRIYKFLGGEAQPYQPSGLPQPLAHPVALVSEGDVVGGALYVADAGVQSIVALTKSGEFIHQIRAEGDALAGLEALAIEERSRTLYVLASGRLYALTLPPLPEPPGASD